MKTSTFVVLLISHLSLAQTSYEIVSPDKNIIVSCDVATMLYRISFKGKVVLENSKLGVVRNDEDFSKNLKVIKASAPKQITEKYSILTAKKKDITYKATERSIGTQTASGKKMNLIFRVSNDGVAFRYEFRINQQTSKR